MVGWSRKFKNKDKNIEEIKIEMYFFFCIHEKPVYYYARKFLHF